MSGLSKVFESKTMDNKTLKLSRSFAWLNATQFLGALNDNVFKLLIVFFLIGKYGKDKATDVNTIGMLIFVFPFLFFTPYAGKLADRFSKRNIVVATKTSEVFVMILGCLSFYFSSPVGVCIVLFLMCTQSAFFGPSKLGIIPELVRSDQLSKANSFLNALTYLAIVIGTAAAPFITQITQGHFVLASLACVVIAAAGAACSAGIHRTAPAGGGKKASLFFWKDVYNALRQVRGDRYLMMAVFASAYFLLIGAFLQMNLMPYGMEKLGQSEVSSAYLFVAAGIGIGLGSYLAGRLSGRSVEFGIVPMGAIGLALCCILLAFVGKPQIGYIVVVYIITFFTGISAGLFIVPLQSFIQLRSPSRIRGEVIAASSFIGWIGILISAGMLFAFKVLLGLSPAQSFFIIGIITLGLAVATIIILPDFLVRFIAVLIARFCYRIKVVDSHNIPTEGGVLLISNHVSWADPVLLAATQQRRIRYVVDRGIYNIWWMKPICRLMKAIPISATDPPKKIIASLKEARSAMEEGYIVCVFAEGAVTRTGMLREFRAGFEKIMKKTSYSIIPAYIGGAWGSILSYYHGRLLSTLPKKFPYPVSIHFGKPMPAQSSAFEIRQSVMELSCDYFNSLKPRRKSMGEQFVRSARKHWSRMCITDVTGKKLKYGRTLIAALALQTEIDKLTAGHKNVGIFLPPSCGAVLANLAITISGKVTVNISYIASKEARDYAIDKCGIECVISSKAFLEKIKFDDNMPGLVYIEDLVEKITPAVKRKALLKAILVPARMLARPKNFKADDVATIIFSSGSTGLPKGVMLSHHNILSNTESARMIFKIYPSDGFCAGLPFFHSFGLTFTLWLPLLCGIRADYIPNPLDGKLVAETVRKQKSTVLIATPTFLMGYLRRAQKEDFATLRLTLLGAEKLKRRLADSFEKKFGVTPLEGYGTTELSPLVSLNVLDVEIRGIKQIGNKPGTVGHPIPGIAVKIVDPQDGTPVELGQQGLLLIKGHNVMLGYLDMEEKTAEVITDGWYNTGDIAKLDEDGFLSITDRLARFSKIGGEMVPHLKIEELYLKALGTHEHVLAVTSIPAEKKGEEIAVLYVPSECDPDKLHEIMSNSDLPNIFKPKRGNYIEVDEIPILGTGKLDIMGLRKIALAAKVNSPEA